MIRIIVYVVAMAAALTLISRAGIGVSVNNFTTAVIVGVVWGLVSVTIKPVLTLLTLPINLLTLGVFSFVLNALLFMLVAALVPHFFVTSFLGALIGSALLMLVAWGVDAIF